MKSVIDCYNVYVKQSGVCDQLGAFATIDFKKDDIIETGVARILKNCDGHENSLLFTWSNDLPNTTWAVASGMASFYNSTVNQPNTEMIRNFIDNSYIIKATRDIKRDEELFHTYKSIKWRKCFSDIRDV